MIYVAAMVFKFLFEDPYTILLKFMFKNIKNDSCHAKSKTIEEKNCDTTTMDELESNIDLKA